MAASNLKAQNTTIFKNQTNDKFYHTVAAALLKETYDYSKNKRVGTWNVAKRTDSETDIAKTAISGLTVAVILSF